MADCLLFRSIRRHTLPVIAIVAAVLLAGCLVLIQNNTFAIGTESNRANLVLHVGTTNVVHFIIDDQSVSAARNAVLAATPSSLSIPTAVRVIACSLGVAGCVAQWLLPDLVMSWWKDDVRNRGDFAEAVDDAVASDDCFAWTFVAGSGRNFTHKPPGNSGCKS